jgi:hypothetical protein
MLIGHKHLLKYKSDSPDSRVDPLASHSNSFTGPGSLSIQFIGGFTLFLSGTGG